MSLLSKQTAMDIALIYREIENGEALLAEVETTIAKSRFDQADIRDAFGRRCDGLELGVPTDRTSRRLFNVPWSLALPVIKAHLAQKRAELDALSEAARAELQAVSP